MSCGSYNDISLAEVFPLSQDPELSGNYHSACLITMEMDFLQIAKSMQNTGTYLYMAAFYICMDYLNPDLTIFISYLAACASPLGSVHLTLSLRQLFFFICC